MPDADGDRIMDFSGVGYKGQGTKLIPDNVPNMVTISPVAGDDTAHIQSAIDAVAAMAPGPDGFRGAVLLEAGHYDINTQLTIGASGVVLRGVGRDTSDTVLHGRGTGQRPLIRVLGSGSPSFTGNPKRNMIDKVVPVGATSFRVDNVAELAVGDAVRVERPSTAAWIEAVGMDEPYAEDPAWVPNTLNIRFDRVITRIEGNRVFLDAPLANAFELQYGGGTIQKYNWADRIEGVGVENLRAESDFTSSTDENHAWEFVSIENAQDVWVRHTTSRYFGNSAVVSNPTAKWVTVDDAINLDPISTVTGERRYTFDMSGQLELVTNSQANSGRHDFINNSTRPPGPHVFHNSVANNALNDSGPHNRWATGSLFDNITVNGDNINARNRENLGTRHGWSGANMVIWNSTADGFIVQNPPTAQNWLIGSTGTIINDTEFGPQPPGYVDSHGTPITVGGTNSLYEAQMNDAADIREFHWSGGDGEWQDHLAWQQGVTPGVYDVSTRDYLVGDIDDFTHDGAGSVDNAYIDPAWQSAIQSASGLPITKFDDLVGDRNVAFTIQHQLADDERVVHGFLALCLQQSGGTVDTDFIRFFDMDVEHRLDFTELGWDTELSTTEPFVGVIDLGAKLDKLQSGSVNVQVNDDSGVDWAMYVVTVAKPIADAVGPRVYLDGGGTTSVTTPIAPLDFLQNGGEASGQLMLAETGSVEIKTDYQQLANGTLEIELNAGHQSEAALEVAGQALLSGALQLTIAPEFVAEENDILHILTAAGGIDGMFADIDLEGLAPGLAGNVVGDGNSLWLEIFATGLAGDFNDDGIVDAADYTVWRNNLGTDFDLNGNGDETGGSANLVDAADYLLWKANYGEAAAGSGGLTGRGELPVPEPATFISLFATVLLAIVVRRRHR